MKIQVRAMLRAATVVSFGALMVGSAACKDSSQASSALPAMSLASTLDQGAAVDESTGIAILVKPTSATPTVSSTTTAPAVTTETCVPGEGRACSNVVGGSGAASGPHRDVVSKPDASDKTPLVDRAK